MTSLMKLCGGFVGLAVVTLCGLMLCTPRTTQAAQTTHRPNILWISTEDISPDLGCYGDSYAVTPNVDRLAAQGMRYTNAFATAPVCAPSRSAIITGMYPTTIGSMHMRSKAVPAAGAPPTGYGLGRLQHDGALAQSSRQVATLLRRLQHHGHARKPGARAGGPIQT